ncbi:hypothetical protein V8F06_010494 [Rhypophila decipiens]
MLERTAASIEPCGFRRVLPCSSSKYSLSGQRRLHTSFWQNAAPDIELLDACSALMRMSTPASLGAVMPTKSENKFESSLASTFVLDFLYPNWAAPSLRRFRATLTTLQPFSGEQKARALTARLYTSSSGHKSADSAPSKTPDSPSPQTEVLAPQTDISDASEAVGNRGEDATQTENVLIRSDKEHGRAPIPGAAMSQTGFLDELEQLDRSSKLDHRVLSGPDGLRQFLTSQDDDIRPYESVWTLYSGLNDAQKQEFRTDVTLYLSRSTRPVEAWRVCELFSLYSIEEWTDDLVEAAVRARLMFQDLTTAQAIFTTALEKRELGKALDPFVVYCFRTENWQLFFDAWALFEQHLPRGRPKTQTPKKSRDALETPKAPEPGDSTLNTATAEAVSPCSRPFIFRALAAFPDFEAKLKKLWDYAVQGERQAEQQDKEVQLRHTVRSFLKLVAARSLPFFSPKDATVMVQFTKDKRAYEAFIHLCVERGWAKLAMEAYKNYRELSGQWIRGSVLQVMVHVFYQQKDTVGMQQLLEDWTSGTWSIGLKAYQKFIAFYARLGDVATVQRLVKDYLKQHKFAKMDPSVLSALIQVHSAAGDCDAARRVLEEYVATSAVPPNTVHWNNLIQAYVKARDFEGAMSAFMRLCEENQPNQHSFGIVMGMAGSRGDLRLTLDLLRLSGELGVRPNTAMLDTLVEAYCQNDRFEEAALLCARTAKDADVEGSRTGLWNTLLHHHAKRRDLSSVNRILEYMTKHGVSYDEHTYGSLLQALVNCKQVHHAVHFLRVALREGVFQPTDSHYVLIMSGFLRTGEGYLALKTNELIKNKFPDTTNRMTAIIRALGNAKITLHSAPLRLGNDRLQYVNRALWLFRNSFGQESSQPKGNHRAAAEQYSQVILMLIQMRDFASVQDILSLYSLQFPARASEETMPIKLMLDMMLADFHEKKFGRVKEVFNIILTRMERAGKQSSVLSSAAEVQDSSARPPAGQLAPAFRYELCDALKTMQRLFQETDDAQGLIDMVEDVQRRGFKLDSKNWNIYVQALARMNRWQEAFMACEKELMPAWFGWPHIRARTPDTKTQLPLELRRLTSYSRVARPITYTMLTLIRVWMDLDKLTLWSSEAEKMMQKIKDTCPRTVRAVTETGGGYNNWLEKATESILVSQTPEERERAMTNKLRRLSRSEYPHHRAASPHMESLRRLARAELEQDEYDMIGDAFAQDEKDSTPQMYYTRKSIDDVKTPYPWRNTWTRGEGLQMRQSDKPLAPESFKEVKKQYFRRLRIEKAEKSIQKEAPFAEPSPPHSSPEVSSTVVKKAAAAGPKQIWPRRVRTTLKRDKALRKKLKQIKRSIYGEKYRRGPKKQPEPPADSKPPIVTRPTTASHSMARPSEDGSATTAEATPSEFKTILSRHLEPATVRMSGPSRRERARAKLRAKESEAEESDYDAGDSNDVFTELTKQVAQSIDKKPAKSHKDGPEDFQ